MSQYNKHDGRRSGGLLLQRPDGPGLVRTVPDLPPEHLHRLIRHAGLEASVDLIEAATDAQLAAVLDIDLWDASRPGCDEAFDADRFGEWVDSLVGRDAAIAARVVARFDRALVVAGLSRHLRVFDPGVLEPTAATDDEPWESGLFATDGQTAQVGGYNVQAKSEDAWDAIVTLLHELSATNEECFHAVMRGCRQQSDGGRELDGLHDLLDAREQLLHDVAVERDDRRVERGFRSPSAARAFLASARRRAPSRPREGPSAALTKPGGVRTLMEELAFLANTLVA